MEAFQCVMFTFFIFPIIIIVLWNKYTVGKRHDQWVQQFDELGALAGWEVPNKKAYGYQVDY